MDELLEAVINGSVKDMMFCLKFRCCDINDTNSQGRYALMEAIKLGYTSMIEAILDIETVNVNIQSKKFGGKTPVMLAALWQREEALSLIFSKQHEKIDINIQDRTGSTALTISVKSGNMKNVGTILGHPDVDINLADKKGNTALIIAAMNGHARIVRTLLQLEGIDVDAINKKGETALKVAVQKKRADVVAIFKGGKGMLLRGGSLAKIPHSNSFRKLSMSSYKSKSSFVENKTIALERKLTLDSQHLTNREAFSVIEEDDENASFREEGWGTSNKPSISTLKSENQSKRLLPHIRIQKAPSSLDVRLKPLCMYSQSGRTTGRKLNSLLQQVSLEDPVQRNMCFVDTYAKNMELLHKKLDSVELFMVFTDEPYLGEELDYFDRHLLVAAIVYCSRLEIPVVAWKSNEKKRPFRKAADAGTQYLDEHHWKTLEENGIFEKDVVDALASLSSRVLPRGNILERVNEVLKKHVPEAR